MNKTRSDHLNVDVDHRKQQNTEIALPLLVYITELYEMFTLNSYVQVHEHRSKMLCCQPSVQPKTLRNQPVFKP